MSIFTIFRSAPKFSVWHSHPEEKSKILITAGVDGDEYAGIKAAQKLITDFTANPPGVALTIIPLVNIAGNEAGVSYNPLDARFPKSIYPGSPYGTSSSRLRWELIKHAKGISLWIDLHGGALDEHLNPFVWAGFTNNTEVDKLTTSLLSELGGTTLYAQGKEAPYLTSPLGRVGTSYLLLESGELGQSTDIMVNQHISWVKTSISTLESLKPRNLEGYSPTYTHIHYHDGEPSDNIKDLLWSAPTYYATAS